MSRIPHPRRAAAAGLVAALGVAGLASVPHGATAAGNDDAVAWLSAQAGLRKDTSCADPSGARIPVVYRTDRLVVRSSQPPQTVANQVSSAIQAQIGPPPTGSTYVASVTSLSASLNGADLTPVLVVRLNVPPDTPIPIVNVSRALRAQGLTVSPDYGLVPAGGFVFFWPYGDPVAATSLEPQRVAPFGQPAYGTGVTIGIYDTGLAPSNQPARLTDVSKMDVEDDEQPDRNGDGEVDAPDAGHGLAMAGVIKTIAPGATVKVARITDRNYVASESDAAARILGSLAATPPSRWPSLLVMAFGSPACDLTATQPSGDVTPLQPLAMEAVAQLVNRNTKKSPDGMLMIASAGNRGSTRPFYPAGFNRDPALAPGVVAVGAVDATLSDGDSSNWYSSSRTGPLADFSNRGTWVDGAAPGVALNTTQVVGLKWQPTSAPVQGIATVSGTSFSAPYLSGVLATEMATSGSKALAAWNTVKVTGATILKPCKPGAKPLGKAKSITLAKAEATPTTPPTGLPPVCPP